jgi:hypothetical protein
MPALPAQLGERGLARGEQLAGLQRLDELLRRRPAQRRRVGADQLALGPEPRGALGATLDHIADAGRPAHDERDVLHRLTRTQPCPPVEWINRW